MGDFCKDRVVVVTGAGRGIGRSEAIAFAKEGAKVVVSDLGVELDGSGRAENVAELVVEEIRTLGGEAVSIVEDVGDTPAAKRILDFAIDTYGGLDVVVNNAGILRDRMIFNMSEEDFDSVLRVHLKGSWNLTRWAAIYWRDRSKTGSDNEGRIINTSSPAGLYGNVGQTNYSPAKAAIAALTITAAAELERYGVTVNAISPVAATRMTMAVQRTGQPPRERTEEELQKRSPDQVAPLVVWLGSRESKEVTGRVFEVGGGAVGIAEGWRHGPSEARREGMWAPAELTSVVSGLLSSVVDAGVVKT